MKKYRVYAENHFPIDMDIIHTSEEDGYNLGQYDQEYTSEKTSINSKQLPAIYKLISFHPGDLVVDYGGGKFDNAVEYLKDKDVTLCVYDPYNRSDSHNSEVLNLIKQNGGADAAVCSNVLNVIKEPQARLNVLKNISKITKSGSPVYITVYEGSGKGNEGPTKSGYQLNRKTEGYLEEIQEVFPDAQRKGKLVVAHNKSVKSATNTSNVGSITCSIGEDYDSFITEKYLGTEYAIHYTSLDDVNTQDPSPEDDREVFQGFKAQITVVSHYDDAEYYWARILGSGKIQYIHEGRVKYSGKYDAPNQKYEDLTEWLSDICSHVERKLREYNMKIEPRIIHDSIDITSDVRSNSLNKNKQHVVYESKDAKVTRTHINSSTFDMNDVDIMTDIREDVGTEFKSIMRKKFGFDDVEFKDYCFLDVYKTVYGNEPYYEVDVGAELDFDDLMDLADELNPVIEYWDKDAYFDAEDSGRLNSLINSNSARNSYINSSDQSSNITSSMDYEDDGFEMENGSDEDEITINFKNQRIIVDEDGNFDWEDDTFTNPSKQDPSRASSGSWYSGSELYTCDLDDSNGVIEKLMDLVYPNIPFVPGEYEISGIAHMMYTISYVYTYDTRAERLDYYDDGYKYIDPDSYDVNYDLSSSWIENFSCTKIG